ncbi:MAG: dolichyl-phosphate beta-glucosyltransferase [Acidobacteriota bacterium]
MRQGKSLHHATQQYPAPHTALSVIIPAYNEESRLGPSLDQVLAYLESRFGVGPDAPFEVLVVDDGSADATAVLAESFAARGVRCLEQPYNLGKGAALRRGVLESRGRLLLLTDADMSTPVDDLGRLESRLEDAAVVIGSRAVAESQLEHRQPLYRELMGKTFNKIVRLAGVGGLNDTQCGFKLLDGEVARRIFPHLVTPGFGYDVEMIWLARRFGYRVVEVGVRWAHSPPSRVRPIQDSLRMLLEIVRFRWLHRGFSPPADPAPADPTPVDR